MGTLFGITQQRNECDKARLELSKWCETQSGARCQYVFTY